jgi:putative peptidoglycan lipid II flippase
MLFSMIFFSLSSICRSILNSYQSFTLPGLQQTVLNLSIILMIIIGVPFFGVYALAWGFLFGSIIQLLIQIPSVAKRIRYGFSLSKTSGFFSAFLPLLLVVPIGQLNIMVTKIIASMLGEGNVSALGYSEKMMEIANNLLAVPISTVIFPYLSVSFHKQDLEGFAHHLKKGMNILFFATFPITLFFLFFSQPLIEILFKRGLFSERSVELTSTALFYYAFAGLFGSINYLLVYAFYSLRKIRVIVGLMSISFVANILLAILLSKLIGIGGITLSMSISSCLLFFLLLFFLSKEIGFQIKDWLLKMALRCIMQIVVFCFIFWFYTWLPLGQVLRLVVASISILISISLLSWAFKIEEFIWLIGLIKRR